MDTNYFYKLLEGYIKKFSYSNFPRGGVCLLTPDYAHRAEPEPPVTMMLSHFSGGDPVYLIVLLANELCLKYTT